jgi:Ca2+:H+ antiporter
VRVRWTTVAPLLAVAMLALTWGRSLPGPLIAVVSLLLAGAVLSAVYHAEVIAHRVGEPFGSLVLAVSVTTIEVALIITLMASGGADKDTLARDTVFAALMITCNGIVGLSLLFATRGGRVAQFNAEGTGAALATIAALATLSLVLPTFTTSTPGPTFTTAQLSYAAVASLTLYGLFVVVQTLRHRDQFLPRPSDDPSSEPPEEPPGSSVPPGALWRSVALLLVALVGVVGLAKTVSPTIESAVRDAGLPLGVVGVVIASLVLLPEGLAAVRAARNGQVQTSLNLSYGSAMASIGLTIPAIALASLWLEGPLKLGLGPTQLVLLALTVVVSILTVAPGRATLLQGGIHVTVLAGFFVLAVSP